MLIGISLIIAALFGLWGYKKGFYPAWTFVFNVITAIYLSLMLTPTVLDLAGERLDILGLYSNVLVMISIAILYFVIAHFVSASLLMRSYRVAFPDAVDKAGGPILGFVGGFILINFILFSIAISPLEEIPLISKYIPSLGVKNCSGRNVVHVCRFVSGLSLQYGDRNIPKALEIVSQYPAISSTKTAAPKINPPESNLSPVPIPKKHSKIISDLNEQ